MRPRRRVDALDALRGFALGGILLVNIPQLTDMPGYAVPGELLPAREALDLLVQHRFFPIFSFLFGLSFTLVYEGARTRSAKPRLVLLRRLSALAVLGALHQFLLYPGEALLPYAVAGLLVLLPSTWLPRSAVLAAGLLATAASITLASGGVALIPGLFLLGAAAARYGVVDALDRDRRDGPAGLHGRDGLHGQRGQFGQFGRWLAVVFAVAAPLALAAALWQRETWASGAGPRVAAVAGLVAALAYVCGFLLLMRTPVRALLVAVFAPLGRVALTHYVSATLIVLAVAPLLHLHGSHRWGTALGLAAAILGGQLLLSRLWLARFRQGPLEWVWRWATWGRVERLRVERLRPAKVPAP